MSECPFSRDAGHIIIPVYYLDIRLSYVHVNCDLIKIKREQRNLPVTQIAHGCFTSKSNKDFCHSSRMIKKQQHHTVIILCPTSMMREHIAIVLSIRPSIRTRFILSISIAYKALILAWVLSVITLCAILLPTQR